MQERGWEVAELLIEWFAKRQRFTRVWEIFAGLIRVKGWRRIGVGQLHE